MNNNPLVSIIIPTYNRAYLIKETLQSVQNQTYQNWECFVVDDRSSDKTIEIITKLTTEDSRFKILQNNRSKGAHGARNTGIEKSKGVFIYFFDSDDIMYPDLLETFVEVFKKDLELDFCCCDADFFNNEKTLQPSSNFNLQHNIESHLKNYGFMAPSFFTKKEVIETIGFWNENLHRLQDVEYFSRLFSERKKGSWIDRILFKVRVHENSITGTWSKQISKSLIKVHKIIYARFKSQMSNELRIILGRRITAFSISALASGFWVTAWRNFWFGLKLLPASLRGERLITFLKISIKKPFKKSLKEIWLYY